MVKPLVIIVCSIFIGGIIGAYMGYRIKQLDCQEIAEKMCNKNSLCIISAYLQCMDK